MSTTTTNYNLHKIDLTDAPPDITVINPNWDTIDTELSKRATLGTDGKVPSSQLPAMDYVPNSEKASANGVATLDANGNVPASQLGNVTAAPTGAVSTIYDSNLTANRVVISNGSGKVAVSDVTSTELGYLDNVTSNIQTQLNSKAPTSHNHSASNITSGTLPLVRGGTGATTAAGALTNLGITATAAELNKMDGVTATTTELNYTDGVTSNIQTQLNNKVGKAGDTMTGSITFNNTGSFHAFHKLRTIDGDTRGVNFGCGQLGGVGCIAMELRSGTSTTGTQLARLEIGQLGVSFVNEAGDRTYLHKNTLVSATTE